MSGDLTRTFNPEAFVTSMAAVGWEVTVVLDQDGEINGTLHRRTDIFDDRSHWTHEMFEARSEREYQLHKWCEGNDGRHAVAEYCRATGRIARF